MVNQYSTYLFESCVSVALTLFSRALILKLEFAFVCCELESAFTVEIKPY